MTQNPYLSMTGSLPDVTKHGCRGMAATRDIRDNQPIKSSGRSAFRSAKPTKTTGTNRKKKRPLHFEKVKRAATPGGTGSPEVHLAPRGARRWFNLHPKVWGKSARHVRIKTLN